jgi:hypothetical protein
MSSLRIVKTSSSGKRARSSRAFAGVVFASLTALSCASSPPPVAATPAGVSAASLSAPVDFAFESLDDRAVTAASTRGVPTVISFITTSSLSSQAQVDFLVAMAKKDSEHVRFAVVALEGSENREMVALYQRALSIPFPVALADAQTLAGGSAFGDVSAVPVTVLLDGAGRIAWRIDGRVVKSEELRRELRSL